MHCTWHQAASTSALLFSSSTTLCSSSAYSFKGPQHGQQQQQHEEQVAASATGRQVEAGQQQGSSPRSSADGNTEQISSTTSGTDGTSAASGTEGAAGKGPAPGGDLKRHGSDTVPGAAAVAGGKQPPADGSAAGGSKAGGSEARSSAAGGSAAGGEQAGGEETGGKEAPDPEDELEFFDVTGRRGVMLEEYTKGSLMEGMESATHMYLSARQGALTPLLHSVASVVLRPVRRLTQRGTERLMQRTIEHEFDTEEFLEGAKGAVEQVMRLYGEQEWDELEGMVSEKMLADMKDAHQDLLERKNLKVQGITCDVREVSLQLTCVWGRSSVAAFDAGRAGAELIAGAAPYWNLVFCDVISSVNVRMVDADHGRPAESATQRQGVFAFARGPLPRRGVPEVHAPWWIIGWL